MAVTHSTAEEQRTHWNGRAGRGWVDLQEVLDRMFKPFEDLLVEAFAAQSASHVLDIGCGTGSTTLAVARREGGQGSYVGIDISGPMLAAARARAEREHLPATFIQADAQTHAFEPESFDKIISRFGVMFFDDFVGAFANLRRAAKQRAELRFIAWRSPSDNPFMTTAERAAAPLLPNMPARRANAPGQFAFADQSRVRDILKQSAWKEVDIRPIDVACTLPEHALIAYVTRLGPLGLILEDADEPTRARVIDTVRAAFESYVDGTQVRFNAACWLVNARAPSA